MGIIERKYRTSYASIVVVALEAIIDSLGHNARWGGCLHIVL